MPISDFIKAHGIIFSVSRHGNAVGTETGLNNYDKLRGKNYINFYPSADVAVGDVLTSPDGRKVYAYDTTVLYVNGVAQSLDVYYMTEKEMSDEGNAQQTVFNIGTATNSVIGNGNSVSMTISGMREKASRDGGADEAALQEIISLLEKIISGQEPPRKGLLGKFSACLERNSWISSAIASAILGWLL